MADNPFIIKGYKSAEYFCNRKAETASLLSNIKNGADTTLISPRKYGKTGLILHVFNQIRRQKLPFEPLYVDIYATLSTEDFIKALSAAIIEYFPEKTTIGKKFLKLIKSIRPVFTYDPMNGIPQVSFNFATEAEKITTLKELFEFLDSQDKPVVLAIDEFQQIVEYAEKNVEALLRSCTQNLHNIRLIYCGSKRKIMSEIFHNANRPFFSSTATLSIDKISSEDYAKFISDKFKKSKGAIEPDAIEYILQWTMRHTFYTQSLCNQVFRMQEGVVTLNTVYKACKEILDREAGTYMQFREFLTHQQWLMLIAVAKEGTLTQPTASAFLAKYNIGGATTARRTLESLVDKELILKEFINKTPTFRIYDVFFSRWLAREY